MKVIGNTNGEEGCLVVNTKFVIGECVSMYACPCKSSEDELDARQLLILAAYLKGMVCTRVRMDGYYMRVYTYRSTDALSSTMCVAVHSRCVCNCNSRKNKQERHVDI